MAFPKAVRAILAAVVSLCTTASVAAQADPQLLPSTPITASVPTPDPMLVDSVHVQRLLQIQQWAREFDDWKAWYARWHNRREPGWFSTRARRQPPDPPAWLAEACAGPLADDEPLVDGCRAWREWDRGDLSVLVTEQLVQTRAQLEAPEKSSWWHHVHVDALWPMTQSGSSAFGVAGTHATVPLSKRVQVFIAPGVILMRLPSAGNGQRWTAATDWGFSYRMFDFKMPATHQASTLHFNIARVWILGAHAQTLERDLYLAGFSVTFRRP